MTIIQRTLPRQSQPRTSCYDIKVITHGNRQFLAGCQFGRVLDIMGEVTSSGTGRNVLRPDVKKGESMVQLGGEHFVCKPLGKPAAREIVREINARSEFDSLSLM